MPGGDADREVRALRTDALERGEHLEVEGSSPPNASTVRRARYRICPALLAWKVTAGMRRSISLTSSSARSLAVGACLKSRTAVGRLTSSRVRMERMQATSWWNTERYPRSASSNIAARGKVWIACRTAARTSPTSKGILGPEPRTRGTALPPDRGTSEKPDFSGFHPLPDVRVRACGPARTSRRSGARNFRPRSTGAPWCRTGWSNRSTRPVCGRTTRSLPSTSNWVSPPSKSSFRYNHERELGPFAAVASEGAVAVPRELLSGVVAIEAEAFVEPDGVPPADGRGTDAERRAQSSEALAGSSTMARVLLRTSGTTTGPEKVLMGASVKPTRSANAMSLAHSSAVNAPRSVMMECF